jgi:signal peptidase I
MKCSSQDFLALASTILSQGNRLRFQAQGASMIPLIMDGDILDIEPIIGKEIKPGDIVFYRTDNGRVIVHRVIKKIFQNHAPVFTVRGDAHSHEGEAVRLEDILGRVAVIERGSRSLNLHNFPGRLVNMATFRLSPLWNKCLLPLLKKAKFIIERHAQRRFIATLLCKK